MKEFREEEEDEDAGTEVEEPDHLVWSATKRNNFKALKRRSVI